VLLIVLEASLQPDEASHNWAPRSSLFTCLS